MARKIAWEVRAEAYHRLLAGESVLGVSEVLGVSRTALSQWAMLAGMERVAGPVGGIVVTPEPVPPRPARVRKYARLGLEERAYIQACLDLEKPFSIRRIARNLGVAASTVSREIRAHQLRHWEQNHYDARTADHRARRNRSRSRAGKLEHPPLRAAVKSCLKLRFSPEQTTAELKKRFPEQPEMHVSHETIYQALYVQGKGALRHELTVEKALRSGRTGRKPQSKLPPRSSRPWVEGARISDRPAEVADRAVPGHWEGDLVVGPGNSGIVTLVERTSRFTLLGRLPGARDSATVIDVMQTMITGLPQAMLKSITWDQGTEMARHASFTVATGCAMFFCDPHSPWQRGTNENTNGLIRDIHPKGTNFNDITDEQLAHTQWLLNIRPRKTLHWDTPSERLTQLIDSVALTP